MRAAKVQASLRIRAVSPEPPLLAHTSIESRGTFRQKARSLAPLNGWACADKICHDGMLEDTNSLDGAQLLPLVLRKATTPKVKEHCTNGGNFFMMYANCDLKKPLHILWKIAVVNGAAFFYFWCSCRG